MTTVQCRKLNIRKMGRWHTIKNPRQKMATLLWWHLFDSIYDIRSLCTGNLNLGTIYLVLQWIIIVFHFMYTYDDILSSVLVYHTCNVCRQLPADAGWQNIFSQWHLGCCASFSLADSPLTQLIINPQMLTLPAIICVPCMMKIYTECLVNCWFRIIRITELITVNFKNEHDTICT